MSAPPAIDYLRLLHQAMTVSVRNRQQFWVLAALTDQSYEEGDRNHAFAKCIGYYERGGVPADLVAQLRLGINGNLREALVSKLPPGHRVERNKWKGQDLRIHDDSGSERAGVEVKPLFDLTFNKHYLTTAADYRKLLALRRRGFGGGLFLAVFFIQLPNYCYGPGRWCGKPCGSRRDQFPGTWGIAAQYQRLRRALPQEPCWPDKAEVPHREPLRWPGDWKEIEGWFHAIYQPDTDWDIKPGCLDDAAVGLALWECP